MKQKLLMSAAVAIMMNVPLQGAAALEEVDYEGTPATGGAVALAVAETSEPVTAVEEDEEDVDFEEALAAVRALDDRYTGILDGLPAHHKSKAWAKHIWERPKVMVDGDIWVDLDWERLSESEDPLIQTLKDLDAKATARLYLNTEDLNPEALAFLAADLEATEPMVAKTNRARSILILDWTLQAFLEGFDPALARLHRYADDEEWQNPIAQNLLGLIYGTGARVPKDERRAFEYFSKAADAGIAQARTNMLTLLDPRSIPATLLEAIQSQIRDEDREAMYQLANMLPPDHPERAGWMEQAAALEHPVAGFRLGEQLIEKGRLARGVHFFKEAAEQGHSYAMDRLADCYAAGRGVEQSAETAAEHSRLYAETENLFHDRKLQPLREANEYPQYRSESVSLSPWVLSSLRPDDVYALEEDWKTIDANVMFNHDMYAEARREDKVYERSDYIHLPFVKVALDFTDKKIGPEGGRRIAELLPVLPGLTVLDLDGTDIDDDVVQAIAANLRHVPRLVSLRLQNNPSITSVGATAIAEGLRYTPELEELNVSGSNIGDEGAIAIADKLRHVPGLKTLGLQNAGLEDAGVIAVAENLAVIPNLELLHIGQNAMSDEGALAIIHNLRQNPKLKYLDLSLLTLSPSTIIALVENLQYIPLLETLSLKDADIDDEGLTAIASNLHYVPGLQELYLNSNKFGVEGIRALSENLQYVKLKTLDVYGNDFGNEGLEALAEQFHRFPEMELLDFTSCGIGPRGAAVIADNLHFLPNLRLLDLRCNRISDEGAEAFAAKLYQAPKLEGLHLYDNELTDRGASAIAERLPTAFRYCNYYLGGSNSFEDLSVVNMALNLLHPRKPGSTQGTARASNSRVSKGVYFGLPLRPGHLEL